MENDNVKLKNNKISEGEVVSYRNVEGLTEFLNKPVVKIAEAVTGAFSVGKEDAILIGGRIVQGALKGNMMKQVGREIKILIEKGKIKEDYAKTKHGFQSLSEVLQFIDTDIPDEDRFDAIKAMFYFMNSKDSGANEELIGYELLKIIKSLTSIQILILKTADKIRRNGGFDQFGFKGSEMMVSGWFEQIAKSMGHNIVSIVEKEEENLVKNKLILSRIPNMEKYVRKNNARLSDLGVKLCEILEKYSFDNLVK